ncbi:hypothetical protein LguiA_017519 [Lonicera macranthoides]
METKGMLQLAILALRLSSENHMLLIGISTNYQANWNGGKEKLRAEEMEESRRQKTSEAWSTATEGVGF